MAVLLACRRSWPDADSHGVVNFALTELYEVESLRPTARNAGVVHPDYRTLGSWATFALLL